MDNNQLDKCEVTETKLVRLLYTCDSTGETVPRRLYWCRNTLDRLNTEYPYTGVDNRTGHMWTEDFKNKIDMYNWFKGYCND